MVLSQLIHHGGVEGGDLASIREALDPLTVVAKQHFVEWFSGDALDTIWTETDHTGTFTRGMADEVNGGYKQESDTTSNANGTINFNSIQHYDSAGSTAIIVAKQSETTNIQTKYGLVDDPSSGSSDSISIGHNSVSSSFWRLLTADGAVANTVATNVSADTNFHTFKVQQETSAGYGYVDGVLEATSSSNISNLRMQPWLQISNKNSNVVSSQILYFEAYNT